MSKKRKEFKLPYIGIDTDNDAVHILYGEKGEASVVFQITNSVLQYSANPDDYVNYHQNILNIIKIVGEGHFLQKLDVFSKKVYQENIGEEFLQVKYDEQFNGRIFKNIDTFLVITKKKVGKFNNKSHADFLSKVDKINQLLQEKDFKPVILKEREINQLVRRTLIMDFTSENVFLDNMIPTDTELRVGDKMIRCLPLIDIDEIELPEHVAPYIEKNDKEALKGFPVDTMAFLQAAGSYDTLIYNQVLDIPAQVKTQQKLLLKQKRHSGIPDPANDICVQDIDKLLKDVARENQLLVNAHFNIIISAKEDDLTKAINSIGTALFTQGITPSRNSYNQLELFRSALVGNAVELKEYDWFLTTSDASLCYFFKEALPVSEPSNFFLRFTDRQGIPLKIDPADYPMHIGRINNRNKFVLGPSGSGKSFLMNAIVEQYMLYNTDVVIVDTGDSYSGTCSYYNGKYITYTAEKPITMNPFAMKKTEYNLEKKDFLQTLIALLWKGANGSITQVESDILNEVITSYYDVFFNAERIDTDDEQVTVDQLEAYLTKHGIDTVLLLEKSKIELENKTKATKNLYAVLRVGTNATKDEIKSSYRKLANKYHPDKNPDIKDAHSLFTAIVAAYSVLSNDEERAKYDDANLRIVERQMEVENEEDYNPKNDSALMEIYSKYLRVKILEIEKSIRIDKLNFNTFYEYCLFKIPLITSKENIPFDIDEFRYVLKKFYQGGEFDSILNEDADKSLFDERFIVFEIDNIKEHKILFPIVTLIIMDVFIQKMRLRKTQRKVLIIEEAWKAIASPMMAGYILYLYKTVRKFWGEAIVVTQELGDIIGNAVVKDSIVNNSDSIILLDQTKFKDNFGEIANLLSLNNVEQKKIFTINNLDNKDNRSRFKEFYFKRGDRGEVYGNEVSMCQYLTYTTEKPEKTAIETYANAFGSYPNGLDKFVETLQKSNLQLPQFVEFVNLYSDVITDDVLNVIKELMKEHKQNASNFIKRRLKNDDITFKEFITNYKKVG